MKFFSYLGEVYTVINPSRIESLPGIPIVDPHENVSRKDLRKASWATNVGPEAAYMLKRYGDESAFLSRLDFDASTLPIVKVDAGYVLAPNVQKAWSTTEQCFRKAADILLRAK